MERMTPGERQALINAIASRAYTASQLAIRYDCPVPTLRKFAEQHKPAIEAARRRMDGLPSVIEASGDITPEQLDDLWITNKFERLKRLQKVAEETYNGIVGSSALTPAEQAMVVREFRSYLMLAANELGQLLHRGAGDSGTGDSLSIDIAGVDMDQLR